MKNEQSGVNGEGSVILVAIKPLSVNAAWQGRRFKSPAYKAYEKELMYRLPPMKLPLPPYRFNFEFGFSNMQGDWDNPCKCLQDIMAKKYGFNDRDIHEATVRKVKVAKGGEYFRVTVESLA